MAEAVGSLFEDPSAKVALWAHNGHLAGSRATAGLRPLGQHLRERFGSSYYALALLCGSGAFRARRLRPGPWPGPMDGPVVSNRLDRCGFNSLEGQLAAANPGDHLLDLRSAPEAPDAVTRWLDEPQMFRSFGAYVQRWTYKFQFTPTNLTQDYDGLAYVATSTPSVPATDLDPEVFSRMGGVMRTIVRRAAERGEIPSADLADRVLTTPVNLLRHEMLLTRQPPSRSTAESIVDEVFLPLVL